MNMGYARVIFSVYCSILMSSYSISSGELGSPDLLLSYPTITLAYTQHHHTNNNPYLNLWKLLIFQFNYLI